MTGKMNDIRESLNYQIQEAITTAITDKVLPSIQYTLGKHGRAYRGKPWFTKQLHRGRPMV